jgi:hypothetical protein
MSLVISVRGPINPWPPIIVSTYGRYYLPLVRIIYRYNNKAGIQRFLDRPDLLTSRLYHAYRQPGQALGTASVAAAGAFRPNEKPAPHSAAPA